MQKVLFFLLFCFSNNLVSAQGLSDIGKIPLGVSMPNSIEGIQSVNLNKLQIKVEQIITANGLTSAGYNPSFAISPQFILNDNKVVEGGMQNQVVISAELTLFVKQLDNNILISSMSITLKGFGGSANEAIGNAISKISPKDNEYIDFIKSSKHKIMEYYDNKCNDLITQSENMVIIGNYEQALSVLMSIPIEAKSCYKIAQDKAKSVYKSYQNKICQSLILNAKTKIAAAEYGEALNLLSQIDPASQCSIEAKELIKITSSKVEQNQKKEWDMALKVYEDNITLERSRIDAIKEIAISYYKRNPHTLIINNK